MDEKTKEALVHVYSNLEIIPNIDGALIFPEDIADITGFQIKCNVNTSRRAVYQVHAHTDGDLTYEESLHVFKEKYQEMTGKPIQDDKKHDHESSNYPTKGADFVTDIAPSTISTMLYNDYNQTENDIDYTFSAYIMRLTQETKRWENLFKKQYEKTSTLRQALEKILNEDL